MQRNVAEGRSFYPHGCRNKEEEVVSSTARSSSSPLPGASRSQRDCCRGAATWSSPGTRGSHSWCWDIPNGKHRWQRWLAKGTLWLVLAPLRGHHVPLQAPGNLHAAMLHLSKATRAQRCPLLSAGKIPPAPRNSTSVSSALLTFQYPVSAPQQDPTRPQLARVQETETLLPVHPVGRAAQTDQVAYSASKSMWLLLVSLGEVLFPCLKQLLQQQRLELQRGEAKFCGQLYIFSSDL